MKILGIIPARGGSKGVPGKNIKMLAGKPLLQYTTDIALQCDLLEKVIVSSDDDTIIQVALSLGVSAPFKRPSDLAEDTSSSLSVIQHTLKFFKDMSIEFDAVCLLQVTSPMRSLEFLNAALKKFNESNTDSLVSVREVPHEYNPHWTFTCNENEHLKVATGEKEIVGRRQDLPKAFHRDGSIYITKTAVILDNNSLYGKTTTYIENKESSFVNIDNLEDWQKAEKLFKSI